MLTANFPTDFNAIERRRKNSNKNISKQILTQLFLSHEILCHLVTDCDVYKQNLWWDNKFNTHTGCIQWPIEVDSESGFDFEVTIWLLTIQQITEWLTQT